MFGYIYVTTNLINGKKYVGKRKCTLEFLDSDDYLGSGKIFKQALVKYGYENFSKTVIDIGYSEIDLNKKEKFWISKFDAVNSRKFYNIAPGGNGGFLIAGYDEETRRRIMKNFLEYAETHPGHNLGRQLSDEWKSNIGKSSKKWWDSIDKEKYWDERKSKNRSRIINLGDQVPHYMIENENIVYIQYDKTTLDIIQVYNGYSEIVDKYKKVSTRCLHDAIKYNKIWRKSYWKAMTRSQSTRETTPIKEEGSSCRVGD